MACGALLLLALAFVATPAVDAAAACSGRQIKSLQVTPCAKENVLTVVNASARFIENGANCELAMAGCVQISKPVQTSVMSVVLKKGPLQVYREDDMDACAMGKTLPGLGDLIAGKEGNCKHEVGQVCTPEDSAPMDITQYASMLDMARGSWVATAKLTHDSGKSCIKLTIKIA